MEFGMSDLGPINLGPQVDVADWGKAFYEPAQISPDMSSRIDKEVKKIIEESYKKAVEILKKNKKQLDAVAAKLVDQETLEDEEFAKLMVKK